MYRVFALLVGAVACCFPLPSYGQPPLEAKDGKVTIKITLQSALPQKPLSRNFLLPEYKDSIPGNRAHMFLRCFAEQDSFFGREESAKREKWNAMKIDDLPAEELKDYGGRLLGRDAADAARMLSVDWQLWTFVKRDGVNLLLPDIQKMRALAGALKTRVRGQAKNRDFVGAISTLQTLFSLAKTLETHPTLIGQLVGVAISTIGCDALEELVQRPGCPNLFWSLTDFQTPFIDLRMGVQGERVLVSSHFQKILDGPATDVELQKVLQTIDSMLQQPEFSSKGDKSKDPEPIEKKPSVRFIEWSKNSDRVTESRTRLNEMGMEKEQVAAMSPLQVVVVDDVQQFAVFNDEIFKYIHLPLWQTGGIKDVEELLKKEKPNMILAPMLTASVQRVKQAQARLDQRIAYLRIIEALRMHTYLNSGRVPETLDDIKLPLPVDPVTGKPFVYGMKAGVTSLTGGNANPAQPISNRYYEFVTQK